MEEYEIYAKRLSTNKEEGFSVKGLAMRMCLDKKNEDLYFYGGHIGEGEQRGGLCMDFSKFNLRSRKWESLGKAPQGRLYPSVFFNEVDQRIYIWGGKKKNDYSVFGHDFLIYDIEEDKWEEVNPKDFKCEYLILTDEGLSEEGEESRFSRIDSPHVVTKFMRFPSYDDRNLLCLFGWSDIGETSQRCLVDFDRKEIYVRTSPMMILNGKDEYRACCFGCIVDQFYYNIFSREQSDVESENAPKLVIARLNLDEMKEWDVYDHEINRKIPWKPTQLSHLCSLGNYRLFLWGGSPERMSDQEDPNQMNMSTFHLQTETWSKMIVRSKGKDTTDPEKDENPFYIKRVGDACLITKDRIIIMGGLIDSLGILARDICEINLIELFGEEILKYETEKNDSHERASFLIDTIISSDEEERFVGLIDLERFSVVFKGEDTPQKTITANKVLLC